MLDQKDLQAIQSVVQGAVQVLAERMDRLEEKIDALAERMDGMEQRMSYLEQRLSMANLRREADLTKRIMAISDGYGFLKEKFDREFRQIEDQKSLTYDVSYLMRELNRIKTMVKELQEKIDQAA